MKKWTSKKALRASVEVLTAENRKLQQQAAAADAAAHQWGHVANDYKCALDAAYKCVEILQGRLSKFDRQRGPGGRYVKNGE